MYLNSVSMKCELLSRFDAQAKKLPRTGCTRGLDGGKRHLTALWEMWIPARKKKFFGNHVFPFGANFGTGIERRAHSGLCGPGDQMSPSFTYNRVTKKAPRLPYVWHEVEALCQQPSLYFTPESVACHHHCQGHNKLIRPLSYIVPPGGGAKEGRAGEEHGGRSEKWWGREGRSTAHLHVHLWQKVQQKRKSILWAHKSPVSPTLNTPPLPADDKIMNHIFVLSLRMIRTWVNPDLMSPDLFLFFIVDWCQLVINQGI